MELLFLKHIIIPLMRYAERKLFCGSIDCKLYWLNFYNEFKVSFSESNISALLSYIKYDRRPFFCNHFQHPGFTLFSSKAICKDIALLIHLLIDDSYYFECWNSPLSGHALVVSNNFIYSFSSNGLSIYNRVGISPIEECKRVYGCRLFIQQNDTLKENIIQAL